MSNGARHGLGVLIGIVGTAAIAVLALYGDDKLRRMLVTFRLDGSDKWTAIGMLVAAAILIGIMAGSRVSPIASLIGGVVFTVLGGLMFVSLHNAMTVANKVPVHKLRPAAADLMGNGMLLVVGVTLLAASVWPSRWAARTTRDTGASPRYEYGLPDQPYDQDPGRHALPNQPQSFGSPQTTSYDTPLYEPEGRPPFTPPEGGQGNTQELRRPE